MPRPLLDGFDFAALADALAALGADAWLVYDFRHVNPVAERILGPTGIGSRRLFVLLPQRGKPVAVAHRIELQPLADFPGEVRPYGSWRELHGALQALVRDRTLAMEVSPQDAVPYLDRVPHGVVQLLEGFGARIVSSGPLVAGQVLLLDLWAGPTLGSVFADQTWMGFSGRTPDAEVRKVWQTVRDARDAAVSLLRDRWATGKGKGERGNVTGAAVDDAA